MMGAGGVLGFSYFSLGIEGMAQNVKYPSPLVHRIQQCLDVAAVGVRLVAFNGHKADVLFLVRQCQRQ